MLSKFGVLIRKYRLDLNKNLGDMAIALSVSTAYLSAVEHGKKKITDDFINNVIIFLGVSGDDAEHVKYVAAISRNEHRIDVSDHSDSTKEAAAMFARSIGGSTLSEEKSRKILEILRENMG